MSSPLNVHLEHYEGPLDLLLDLIRKQQIEIKDIPIATITAQYLGDAHTLPSTSAPIMQFVAGTVTMQLIGTSGSTMETANFSATLL